MKDLIQSALKEVDHEITRQGFWTVISTSRLNQTYAQTLLAMHGIETLRSGPTAIRVTNEAQIIRRSYE